MDAPLYAVNAGDTQLSINFAACFYVSVWWTENDTSFFS
jgi:hypothetical protein